MHSQPYNLLAGLPPLPPRMVRLPIDDFGFPLPFSVDRAASTPMSRMASQQNRATAHDKRLCWTCGQSLGRHATFLVNVIEAGRRSTNELPSHLDCAMWNASILKASDGVSCLWTVHGTAKHPHGYVLFEDETGRVMIKLGKPVTVSWRSSGRAATRTEILHAFQMGRPALRKLCQAETLENHHSGTNRLLDEELEWALRLLPLSAPPTIHTLG